MPQKKILLIQTQAEHAGAQEIARLLADYLNTQGYRTAQIFLYKKSVDFKEQSGIYFCAPKRPHSLLATVRMLRNLRQHIKIFAPDHIITFQHYGNIIGGIAALGSGAKSLIANQLSAPAVVPWFARMVDGILGWLGLYTSIVVNSHDTLKAYAHWPQRYNRHIVTIEHGFTDKTMLITSQNARTALGLPHTVPLIGCVARLDARKRQDVLISMLSQNPEWHVVLAGSGAEETRYKALAQTLGVDKRVHFLGEKPPEKIGMVLAALDIFAFPSEAETFGLAAVEAAQAGVPVVAYNLPVLREVLQTPSGAPCAEFVASHAPEEWGKTIASLLDNTERCNTLKENGQTLKTRYSLEAMAEAYIRLLENPSASSVRTS